MRKFIAAMLLMWTTSTFAQEFVLSPTPSERVLPSCSTSWSFSFGSGTDTYRCQNGKVELSSNDTIRATGDSILDADDGFDFDGGNTVGDATYGIDLESSYGSLDWSESNNKLYGGFDASSSSVSLKDVEFTGGIVTGGDIVLEDSNIGGSVSSQNNKVEIKRTEISGNIDANGEIKIEELSKVTGNITTPNNKVTVKESEVTGNISANGDITVEESQIVGDLSSPNNKITVKESDVTGDANANGEITIEDTVFIGDITSSNNSVKLEDGSEIVGDVTAGPPTSGTVFVNGGSTVEGSCLYNQSPNNSCGVDPLPNPIALYHLEEPTWSNIASEVKDSSGNTLNGRAFGGALTATASPALASINDSGTCGYGVFEHNNNQFVEIPDNNLLDLSSRLTISAWIYPTSLPSGGGLHTIVSKDTNYEFHLDSSGRLYWWWEESNTNWRSLTSSTSIPLNEWTFVTVRYRTNGNNTRAQIYINGERRASSNSGRNRFLNTNARTLRIGQDYNTTTQGFDGSIDEVQIFDEYLDEAEIRRLYRQRHSCSMTPTPQCFTDDFSSSPLSNLWVTSTSKGSFQPQIINNRLRFTQAVRNQATSSTYQRLFPAADNLVEIEFDHFAYGGNGADGIAIVLSDALITPRAGAFGGPLGYGFKPNEPGFAGGWLGVGIDEYGNFSREGGEGSTPGRRRQSVAIRGSGVDETGYRYLAGACNNGQTNTGGNCLSPTVDNNNSGSIHRYRIVVDSQVSNQSQVEISRKIGSGSWQSIVGPVNVLASQFNQAAVPADFLLSVTGSTGSVTNIHEIDNFEVCALRSRPINEQIDHFRITHTGQGVTCNRSEVTIQACKNATCSELFTDTVTVSLDPSTVSGGGGWEGGYSQSFTGGSGTFYIRKYQPGTITLDVMGSNPPARPFSTNLCQIGSGGWSASNCDLVFSDSGFEIDVPDKYAAEAVEVTISAVKQGDSNTKCDVGFGNVTKSVALWSQYLNPSAPEIIGDPKVSVDPTGTYIELNTSESGADNFDLAFDSNGQTKFNLNYDDAGQLQLNAKFTGTGDESGLELTGASNFVSFPASLAVVAKNSAGVEEECTSIDAFCNWFTKAGANFNLEVTALSQTNQPTPNYTHSGIDVAHKLASPDTATSQDGTISTVSYDHSAVVGSTNIVPQSLSEVGVFDFTITPPATFNGSNAKTIEPAQSVYLRFIPAYFAASVFQSPTLQATCNNSFSYIGQPFSYLLAPRLALNPKATNGADVTNYQFGDFWRYDSSWPARTYSDTNTSELISFDEDAASVGRFTDPTNASVVQLNNEQITYTKSASPINSFSANLQLTLGASDITDQDNVCYKIADSDSNADCLGISFNSDNAMQLYWGRLLLNDTYGSELSALRQRLELQYYNSNQFVTNTADSCTNFDSVTNFSFVSSDYTVITSGSPTPPEVNVSLTSATASNGESWLEFSAPGSGNTGTITSSFDMQSNGVPWLREDVDNDGSLDDDNSVSGQVQFGTYRGSDRVIWWNEQD